MRSEFEMLVTNFVNVVPEGKKPYSIITVVSPDSGDSMKLFTNKKFDVPLKLWEWYILDIEISMNGDKTYKNLHGIRPKK